MATLKTNDRPVFDQNTLRLIIGALAFAFPAVVIVLTGKITTSISASYHEAQTRNVFVGFSFIIGALLISYKGHIQAQIPGKPRNLLERIWEWLKKYQEDAVSTIGGLAAIATALFPTACDTCSMDTNAKIHMTGAFILFSNVVYFCLIAFLRSLNRKLLDCGVMKGNHKLKERIKTIRHQNSAHGINLVKQFWNYLTCEIQIFLAIAMAESRKYSREKVVTKTIRLWLVYGKKITRGWVYLICGSLIALVLSGFLVTAWSMPDLIMHSKATFLIETITLGLFGTAWMTASQLQYIRKIQDWFESRQKNKPAATLPDSA